MALIIRQLSKAYFPSQYLRLSALSRWKGKPSHWQFFLRKGENHLYRWMQVIFRKERHRAFMYLFLIGSKILNKPYLCYLEIQGQPWLKDGLFVIERSFQKPLAARVPLQSRGAPVRPNILVVGRMQDIQSLFNCVLLTYFKGCHRNNRGLLLKPHRFHHSGIKNKVIVGLQRC